MSHAPPPYGSERPARDLRTYRDTAYRSSLMPPEPAPYDPDGDTPAPPVGSARAYVTPPPDRLTDSGARKLMYTGTTVRISYGDGRHRDVALLALRNLHTGAGITTWQDLLDAARMRHDLEILGPVRGYAPAWNIAGIDVISDQPDE